MIESSIRFVLKYPTKRWWIDYYVLKYADLTKRCAIFSAMCAPYLVYTAVKPVRMFEFPLFHIVHFRFTDQS